MAIFYYKMGGQLIHGVHLYTAKYGKIDRQTVERYIDRGHIVQLYR